MKRYDFVYLNVYVLKKVNGQPFGNNTGNLSEDIATLPSGFTPTKNIMLAGIGISSGWSNILLSSVAVGIERDGRVYVEPSSEVSLINTSIMFPII